MPTWIAVLLVLISFNVGFAIGAWWRSVFSDMPLVEVHPIPAEDTYGRASKALMEGKL